MYEHLDLMKSLRANAQHLDIPGTEVRRLTKELLSWYLLALVDVSCVDQVDRLTISTSGAQTKLDGEVSILSTVPAKYKVGHFSVGISPNNWPGKADSRFSVRVDVAQPTSEILCDVNSALNELFGNKMSSHAQDQLSCGLKDSAIGMDIFRRACLCQVCGSTNDWLPFLPIGVAESIVSLLRNESLDGAQLLANAPYQTRAIQLDFDFETAIREARISVGI